MKWRTDSAPAPGTGSSVRDTAALWFSVAQALGGRTTGERIGAFSCGSAFDSELLLLKLAVRQLRYGIGHRSSVRFPRPMHNS